MKIGGRFATETPRASTSCEHCRFNHAASEAKWCCATTANTKLRAPLTDEDIATAARSAYATEVSDIVVAIGAAAVDAVVENENTDDDDEEEGRSLIRETTMRHTQAPVGSIDSSTTTRTHSYN